MRSEHERGDFNPADDRMDRAMDRAADELRSLPVSEMIAFAMKRDAASVRDTLQHAAADATFDRLKVLAGNEFAEGIKSHLTDDAIRDTLMHSELVLAYMESRRREAVSAGMRC